MNRLNDTLLVQKCIVEKKKRRKRVASSQKWCQKYKHNPPFLIERPLRFITLSELSRQVNVTALALDGGHVIIPGLFLLYPCYLSRNQNTLDDHYDFGKQRISILCRAKRKERSTEEECLSFIILHRTSVFFDSTIPIKNPWMYQMTTW